MLWLQIFASALALGVLGIFLASHDHGVAMALLAAPLFTVMLLVIFDLDRPHRGLITIPDASTVPVRTVMTRHDRVVSATPPKAGIPRSAADADALSRFDQRMAFPLIVSAVVPLFLLPGGANPALAATVFIAAWAVFLVDLVEHERRISHYLKTWMGRFDLLVVLLTAPWFLIVGPTDSKFLMLIRLARLSRVVMATRGARRLFERLGRVALVAAAVVFVGAAVAYRAEHATNVGFATYGDSIWWAIVTLTTVGYGDIVPKTTAGRVDGIMIMITGISVLGLLAGSMASFFRLDPGTPNTSTTQPPDGPRSRDALAAEVMELRTQVARLVDEVGRLGPPSSDTS